MLRPLQILLAALFVASFAGLDFRLLPGPGLLLVVVLASHAIRPLAAALGSRSAESSWLAQHRFEVGVGLVCRLALALQLNGLLADIGRAPLDVDENRLARPSVSSSAPGASRTIPSRTIRGSTIGLSSRSTCLSISVP